MRTIRRPIYIAGASAVVVAAIALLGAVYFLGIFDPHPRLALDTFNQEYGTEGSRLDTCETCHTSRRRTNAYGSDMMSSFVGAMGPTQGELTEAEALEAIRFMLRSVEQLDSDGDGYSNIDEVAARSFPGNPADSPLTAR